VDLIYLDPPFNSSATYNVLFKEKSGEESALPAAGRRADYGLRGHPSADGQWGLEPEGVYKEIVESGPRKVRRVDAPRRESTGDRVFRGLTPARPRREVRSRARIQKTKEGDG
jgi:site-specific DNA-methyltransferase (adenine-specific)